MATATDPHVIPQTGPTIDDALAWAVENMDYSLEQLEDAIAGMALRSFSRSLHQDSISISIQQEGGSAMLVTIPLATNLKAGLMSPNDRAKVAAIPKLVTLSSSEYDALVDGGTVDPDTYYFIAE